MEKLLNPKVHFFRIVGFVIKYLHKKNKWFLPLIFLATVCMTVLTTFPVAFQKLMIDSILNVPENFLKLTLIYGIVMGGTYLFYHLAFGYTRSRFSLARLDFMVDLNKKYLDLDYRYIEDYGFENSLMASMNSTQGNDNGIELFMHMLFKLPAVLISIILMGALLLSYVPFASIGLLINIFLVFWMRDGATKLRFKKQAELSSALRRINYYSFRTSDFNFGKDIRIFSLQNMLSRGYKRAIDELTALYTFFENRAFLRGLAAVVALTLTDGYIFYELLKKTNGGLLLGDFVMLLSASISLSLLLKETVEEIAKMVGEARYIQSSLNFMEHDFNTPTGDLKAPEGTLEITFDHVSFKYPSSDRYVLKDVSFTIPKGEKLAIVGANGAGKTTIVKLLTGLFSPTEGEIRINGIPQNEYQKSEHYQMFGTVFQDVNILPFDIKTNIALSNEKATDEEILDVLDKVGLKKKVESLPQGIYQKLNKSVYEDAVNLSGGESQKLAIARALYKKSNMVIMDEPTAALDALAEEEIYMHFNELVQSKTAIFISHRLASTKFCDRILLLDGNHIKELGTHDELMNLKGTYYEMFKTQGKYYNEEER
ncbi:ABC transporter ATP-binding protein [Guggenheimella bovis]